MSALIHEFRARVLEAYSRSLLLSRDRDAVVFMKDEHQRVIMCTNEIFFIFMRGLVVAYFIYVLELYYIVCRINFILFNMQCTRCDFLVSPMWVHRTPPPPFIPLSGTYLVLTLCCPAPLPPAGPGFLAAHKLQLICRPYGRSTPHDFPYKQPTESRIFSSSCKLRISLVLAAPLYCHLRYWSNVGFLALFMTFWASCHLSIFLQLGHSSPSGPRNLPVQSHQVYLWLPTVGENFFESFLAEQRIILVSGWEPFLSQIYLHCLTLFPSGYLFINAVLFISGLFRLTLFFLVSSQSWAFLW